MPFLNMYVQCPACEKQARVILGNPDVAIKDEDSPFVIDLRKATPRLIFKCPALTCLGHRGFALPHIERH